MPTSSDARPLAVITGASSGIGLHLAKELAERGYDLVVCAEDDRLEAAADAFRAGGGQVTAVRADLATREGVEQLAGAVQSGRPVDVLCLNAGVGNGGPFIETPLEDDLRLIELDVVGPVHLAKRLLPAMVSRGEGRVLVTASIASIMAGPWYATYAASKAFLLSFAEAVREELKDTGVTITALMPGPVDTDFFRRAGMEDSRVDSMPKDDPADVAHDGLEALFAGEDHVVAHSWRNKVQAALGKGMPEPAKAKMHATMTEDRS